MSQRPQNLRAIPPCRVGIDLGGTKIEGVLLDPSGKECVRRRLPTRQEKGYEGILQSIDHLYRELLGQTGHPSHTVGIGTPGGLSRGGNLLTLSSLQCLNGKPLKRDLEVQLGHPVGIENDANCFALAEALLGAGRGRDLVFGIIMGTGCGGGIVYKGKVLQGLHFRGGEWGHMSMDPQGPTCFCGRRGCVERYISGSGVRERYTERYGFPRTFEQIAEDYLRGDPKACDIIADFLAQFGRAVANLITVLDPDLIVIGGGVSNFEPLYTDGVREVAKNILGDDLTTPIVRNQLGDSSGVLGAALIGI